MKRIFFLLFLCTTTGMHAQNFKGLDNSPMDRSAYPTPNKVTDKVAVITYSRPQLKGRSFRDLVPLETVWRTGANEATELRLFKPIAIGNTHVPEGTYSLYTIFGAETVTLIINGDTNAWGAYSYNQEKDVVRVSVPYHLSDDLIEAFSIVFSTTDPILYMGWENIRVEIPFEVL